MLISRAWKWERVSDPSADVRAAGLSTERKFICFYKIQYQREDINGAYRCTLTSMSAAALATAARGAHPRG